MKSKGPEWTNNLQVMLKRLEEIKKIPTNEKGIHLHLGCGPHVLEGFINIDKYYKHKQVLQYDMYEIPFGENTVDTIYSSHALEHLPIRYANAALYNWFQSQWSHFHRSFLKPHSSCHSWFVFLRKACRLA